MKSFFAIPSAWAAIQTWESGPSFDISYDASKGQLKIDATVPDNQYLAVAYGRGMINTDIVFFPGSATDDLKDLWSTYYGNPPEDSNNDYVDTVKSQENGNHVYTTYRLLDTGDPEDAVIECGKIHQYSWVG